MTDRPLTEELQLFLGDPETWWGPGSIPLRLAEHLLLSAVAVIIAAALVIPAALWAAHRRRGIAAASAVVNIGRAVPTFGILVIVVVWLGLGPWPALVALVALSGPPMFTNTVAGVLAVDAAVLESARGMGMTGRRILMDVEWPLALPVISEGVRIATSQVIATATLAALAAGGGLGRFIVDGFAKRDQGELLIGAVLVAILAVAAERAFTLGQRRLTPAGLRPEGGR
ncbi:MAG: ABC transporter permease [bacterium]|nr:ABC transporter permease [bacterium]MDE0601452.1 ABC transporter permease [bacterium]